MAPGPDPEPAIALVTGAGRGLGRALSLELATRGLRVGALGRNPADLDTLARDAPDGTILPLVADVADADSLRAAFATLDTVFGPVDTLINNAAVYPHRDILDETPESFAATCAINLFGPAACSMLALERMVQTGSGRIVNIVSYADRNPTHLASAYSVSKGATRILTRAMVRDLQDRFPRIVINDWIPGALNTAMGVPDGHDVTLAAKWGVTLALLRDPTLTGTTFLENREHLAPVSLKRRVLNRLIGQTPRPRVL